MPTAAVMATHHDAAFIGELDNRRRAGRDDAGMAQDRFSFAVEGWLDRTGSGGGGVLTR